MTAGGETGGGRQLWAVLHLLDRQLVDREGRMAGKVDDLELAVDETSGQLHVAAVLSGPGALAQRLGWHRLGGWLRSAHAAVSPGDGDPVRIPFNVVSDIGDHITLGLDHERVGSASAERWFREHVVSHLPRSDHAPE
ncbi:MAG TPA: hypothetical protein VHM89_00060 [Acidimicrobiales bacterium]|nr:hypothetical protein [Acidimicrobiales bacterium]